MGLDRRFVLIPLCLALFLAACTRNAPAPKARDPILPPEEFKVHPGLLGQPVPPELRPVEVHPIETPPIQETPKPSSADAPEHETELRP